MLLRKLNISLELIMASIRNDNNYVVVDCQQECHPATGEGSPIAHENTAWR